MHRKAEADYQRGMKYKDIAEKYSVSLNTVKSWKQRHGWSRQKGAPSEKGVHTKRPGAPPGNKNAVGNNGGAPPANSNAVTHGLFQKYLPAETLEIMEQLHERKPLDMLWDNIIIQYTAIIRAQQIMYVKDIDDKTTTQIEKRRGNVSGEKWEVQQAWDKQATFLQAQSRAMGALQSLIRQYEELCRQSNPGSEYQLKLQKLQGEVALLNKKLDSDDDKPIEILIKRKGVADD
ncbi:phage terminase small subunit [Paenibacillus massiliensis]|uniref:phage terminase small subunit n=1 Tax=Paenibacillus massiliensis TaxID=225917 RepID=UPI0004727B94|nr:phage terminase small subunit [Paenibacillus massiliensis]